MKVMSDAVDWITAHQSSSTTDAPSGTIALTASHSPSAAVSTMPVSRPAAVMVRVANSQIQVEDADTSTP